MPAAIHLNHKERLRSCIGAFVGLALTVLLTRLVIGDNPGLPLLLAPMGASAVLLFAVPASPLAQPWPLMGGNLVSAVVGITCARFIPDTLDAAVVAVPIAIAAMFTLRCIHPPSGAVALTAVLGGPPVHGLGYTFAVVPVGLNSLCLLAGALAYHKLTRHRYPHRVVAEQNEDRPASAASRLTVEDINDVLKRRGEMLDVDVDDLQILFGEVEMKAYRRTIADLLCQDVMSTAPICVNIDTPIEDAWSTMQEKRIKALPVLDHANGLAGIVTQMDFVMHSRPRTTTQDATRTGQIMSRDVRTAAASQPIAELIALFAHHEHHHLPVVDASNRLIGMVTRSDLLAGLHRRYMKPDSRHG
jgi:CBS domain-containing membrane protein